MMERENQPHATSRPEQTNQPLVPLYLDGDWLMLSDWLRTEIQHYADVGDSIQLSCLLSHYGCCQIHLGNQHEAHIVYQFFGEGKHACTQSTLKEQAFIYRFLALYILFEGDIQQADQYYEMSMTAFQLLNEAEEEAIMLVEAFRWLYSLVDDRTKKAYIFDRLNSRQAFARFLDLKTNVNSMIEYSDEWLGEIQNYIHFFSKHEQHPHPIIALFQTLFKQLEFDEKENAKNTIYSLLAKSNQYKHPMLKAWAHGLASYILEKSQYGEKAVTPFSKETGTAKLSFFLFGDFAISVDQSRLSKLNWKRKKAEELLVYLLIQPQLKVVKEQLLEEFYPEIDSRKAENRLYVMVHEINKALLQEEMGNVPFVSIKGGKVLVNLDAINEIDVQNYLKLLSVGSQLWFAEREEAINLLEKARTLYDNQFVTHIIYADWLTQFRTSLKEKHVDLLQKLYQHYQVPIVKEQLLHELLACDPLNENFIREKISFLHSQGRHFEAKEYYQKQKELLKNELGLDFNMIVDVVR